MLAFVLLPLGSAMLAQVLARRSVRAAELAAQMVVHASVSADYSVLACIADQFTVVTSLSRFDVKQGKHIVQNIIEKVETTSFIRLTILATHFVITK